MRNDIMLNYLVNVGFYPAKYYVFLDIMRIMVRMELVVLILILRLLVILKNRLA